MSARRLRFVLPLCVVFLSLACILHAQQGDSGGSRPSGPPPGGPPTAAQELERMNQVLSLTDEQKAAILPILEKRHTQIDELMRNSTDHAAAGKEMHAIIDATNSEIRALLTEAQQKLFDTMRPQRPPSQSGNGGGSNGSDSDSNGPPAPPEGSTPPQS